MDLFGCWKRDGPLWVLELLSLRTGQGAHIFGHQDHMDFSAPKGKPQRQVGTWDDIEGVPSRGRKNRGKWGQQNAYQSKRGVKVTSTFVGFAGSTWCSSYYRCPVELDGTMVCQITSGTELETVRPWYVRLLQYVKGYIIKLK